MYRFLFLFLFLFTSTRAFAISALTCNSDPGKIHCAVAHDLPGHPANTDQVKAFAIQSCQNTYGKPCDEDPFVFVNVCASASAAYSRAYYSAGHTVAQAIQGSQATCQSTGESSCRVVQTYCDGTAQPENSSTLKLDIFAYLPDAFVTGISIGLGVAFILALYATRSPIINLIIHGNLPQKLPVYGDDIQCLFKRTQRVNWYGRTVFGIVANLAMTHQQLIDVRKYWLGRVIAFDSLRRQRQNQLAQMHVQLAAKAKSEAHDRKSFWSRRWATLRSFIKKLFWIIIALFNLIMALFFIRVTIAKLTRGTIVESKDLVLILQAKEAIEQSTAYLKEYLTTADTFDGGDEIYEPK